MNILDNLKEQGVSESLIKDIEHFRKEYDVKDELKERVTKSPAFFRKRYIRNVYYRNFRRRKYIIIRTKSNR